MRPAATDGGLLIVRVVRLDLNRFPAMDSDSLPLRICLLLKAKHQLNIVALITSSGSVTYSPTRPLFSPWMLSSAALRMCLPAFVKLDRCFAFFIFSESVQWASPALLYVVRRGVICRCARSFGHLVLTV